MLATDEVLSSCQARGINCDRRTALRAVKSHFRSKKKTKDGLSKKTIKRQRVYSRKDRKLQRRKKMMTDDERKEYASVMTIQYVSSDDDDEAAPGGGVSEKLYRKKLPWRSENLSKLFKNLDDRYQDKTAGHNILRKEIIFKGISDTPPPENAPDLAIQEADASSENDSGDVIDETRQADQDTLKENGNDVIGHNESLPDDIYLQYDETPKSRVNIRRTPFGVRVRGGCNSTGSRSQKSRTARKSCLQWKSCHKCKILCNLSLQLIKLSMQLCI
ncbi:uncharacterized protein [Ptychodera flava]|uniref:uncharacterized protein n=1 Tax=Ptychodera flava TaxID=63121 RepID=UPI003969FF50